MNENLGQFTKPIIRISDGHGIYLDKKILAHLKVQKGDYVKLILTEENKIILEKQCDLLDEETINDLLTIIQIE